MIGKRIALALSVAVLGLGLTLAPAGVALAKKCPTRGKIAKCVRNHKRAAGCNKIKVHADRVTCKTARTTAIQNDCHTCGSSPSGAFLAD